MAGACRSVAAVFAESWDTHAEALPVDLACWATHHACRHRAVPLHVAGRALEPRVAVAIPVPAEAVAGAIGWALDLVGAIAALPADVAYALAVTAQTVATAITAAALEERLADV